MATPDLYVLCDPETGRLQHHTGASSEGLSYARYGEPEGHTGRSAERGGRQLAYRRGLAVARVPAAAILGAATSVIAVSEPAPDPVPEPAPMVSGRELARYGGLSAEADR